ncbi:MAG: hypothetical protein JWL97_4079 [Gemmatimonadales bacterium]|jgi:hypothetical protein|nr:hypothetical protein [Gemmatimonadales bacterium]
MNTSLPWPTTGSVPMPGAGCTCSECAFWTGPDGRGGPVTVEPLCSGSNADCSCAHAEVSAPRNACARCPIRCPS